MHRSVTIQWQLQYNMIRALIGTGRLLGDLWEAAPCFAFLTSKMLEEFSSQLPILSHHQSSCLLLSQKIVAILKIFYLCQLPSAISFYLVSYLWASDTGLSSSQIIGQFIHNRLGTSEAGPSRPPGSETQGHWNTHSKRGQSLLWHIVYLLDSSIHYFIPQRSEAAESNLDPALNQVWQPSSLGCPVALTWNSGKEHTPDKRPMRLNCFDWSFCFWKSGVFLNRKGLSA